MGLFNGVSSISSGGCGKSRPSLPGAVGDASHVGGELGGTRRGGGHFRSCDRDKTRMLLTLSRTETAEQPWLD
ncbi:uncharacterized protein An08g02690 [Aspergillus niger]|uniref:Contig An08c0100, genomic contig n=2 Tax=Aspergillus niger TaxID=5061 RepID=A2QQJ0_ASPNC|nr:uncharacterized protein An08g02690 [Aspergillus niger]CAK45306.1 unnamed protein product [Aspergillus niger]